MPAAFLEAHMLLAVPSCVPNDGAHQAREPGYHNVAHGESRLELAVCQPPTSLLKTADLPQA